MQRAEREATDARTEPRLPSFYGQGHNQSYAVSRRLNPQRRPERYYDHVCKTYGKAFRSGSVEGLETFREIYRQVFLLGNQNSTILFIEKFARCCPLNARRKILIEPVAERKAMQSRSPEENAVRKEELLSPKQPVG